ncbi:hypothetical protein ACH5RR_008908 [Cinchona calisaya]|uniref:Uncharacterized protein n=1 Tax=Cinchona calisaya TaxID=153742 RepID=A0ABD3AF56_9GENT
MGALTIQQEVHQEDTEHHVDEKPIQDSSLMARNIGNDQMIGVSTRDIVEHEHHSFLDHKQLKLPEIQKDDLLEGQKNFSQGLTRKLKANAPQEFALVVKKRNRKCKYVDGTKYFNKEYL